MIKKYSRCIIFFLFICARSLAQDSSYRIKESPYPFSSQPDTLYITSENLTYAEKVSLHSLMGLLAKTKPRILRDVNNNRQMVEEAGIAVIDSFYQDYPKLLNRFASHFTGYILCKSKDRSANVAISLSSVLNALVVPEEIEEIAKKAGLKKLLDARRKNEKWALKKYGNAFSKTTASYQNSSDDRGAYLGDYSIFSGAFQFWDKRSNGSLAKKVYRRMNSGAAFFGAWPDEYKTVEQLSKRSLMVHASDWALNLSTLTNIPAPIARQEPADTFKVIPQVHTVCFLMSDGDNIQWLLNAFNDTSTWNSSIKSKLKLGWTISPALTELAPLVYNKYVSLVNSSKTNSLVASPSGRGYFFPSLYDDLEQEAGLLNSYMKKAGLSIVNIIDTDNGKFNESAYLSQPGIDALFVYSFGDNYTGRKGKITWDHDKPAIGGRYALWEGANTPQSLAGLLNKAPANIYSEDGYSLVPVHVWSRNVRDVMACVQLLNEHVRVVTPAEFVWLIKKNLRRQPAEN
jgi:hypothetical protein